MVSLANTYYTLLVFLLSLVRLAVTRSGSRYLCSGVLLSRDKVLTSAKCVLDYSQILILLGSHDLGARPRYHEIKGDKAVVLHPEYDSVMKRYDFAVVTLNGKISCQPSIIDKN